jgi:hypothetical protein
MCAILISGTAMFNHHHTITTHLTICFLILYRLKGPKSGSCLRIIDLYPPLSIAHKTRTLTYHLSHTRARTPSRHPSTPYVL